ncbi:TRAP transporter fused permease subunit [Natrialba sp. PRR66]|uniref:TRAP transporter permease n=1 Tax=Natrialba sp. PRR66 TaxID=3098146 RepID=UPI002B1E737D|nr:TRAP transporter fused permease subunit [Natrialba sp. PRR66]
MSNTSTDQELSLEEKGDQLPALNFTFKNAQWLLLTVSALVFSVYHIAYGYSYFVNSDQHTIISLCLSVFLMVQLVEADLSRISGKALFAAKVATSALLLYITYYFVTRYSELLSRILNYTQMEYVFALVLIVLILLFTYFRYGFFVSGIVVLSVGYAMFGSYIPGAFGHSSISLARVLERSSLVFDIGLFGFLPGVGAQWIVIFLVYASLLIEFGALQLAIDFGKRMNEHLQSGVPQLAVVTSFVMGSISGSAAANTATTGSVTIPLMKSYGMDGETAAAIESNASSGGQVLPPIMGASAFVMASFLNISYLDVVVGALLPAVIFYLTVSITVYYVSKGYDLSNSDTDEEQILETTQAANQPWYVYLPLLASVLILIYDLGIRQTGPLTAGFHSVISLIGLQLIWNMVLTDDRRSSLRDFGRNLLVGLQKGAIASAEIMVVLGAIAIFVSMLGSGNIVQELSFLMLGLSGELLFPLLLVAMILSIMFGLGMPTVAAYVVVVVFVAPAVGDLGISEFNTHLFVFYFAILSAITPPVALAAVIASGIAEASFTQVAKKAMIMGAPLFILPYTIIYHPSIAQWGSDTPLTFIYLLATFAAIVTIIHFDLDYNEFVSGGIKSVGVGVLVVIMFWGTSTIQMGGFVLAVLVVVAFHYLERQESITATPA